ncbi:MAG: hypothetical protein EOO85_28545 [Pedobacter sp.]|nr:MAG: hypothetical protein EOO85_28545 [Pedobacter sp.]
MKDAVNKFGDRKTKQTVLDQLNNIDYKIPGLGESAAHAVTRIEKLLSSSDIIETSDKVKLRAAQRAINKKSTVSRWKEQF